MTKPTYAEIGAIAPHERGCTLIHQMTHELEFLLARCRVPREARKRFTALLRDAKDWTEQTPGAVLILIDALSHFAPPHSYFGEQDGEWGYWPKLDDDLPRLAHGKNIDAYVDRPFGVACVRFDRRGRCHEYWCTA
jgi:hypothetical protein